MDNNKILRIIHEEIGHQEGLIFEGMTYTPNGGYRNNQLLEIYDNNGTLLLTEGVIDDVQGVLDWAGFIPGIGDFLDAINALIYMFRKKWILGGLSLIAVIPVVGSIISTPFKALHKLVGSKLVKIFGDMTTNGKGAATALLNLAKKGGSKVQGFIKTIYTKIAKYANKINSFLDGLIPTFEKMVSVASLGFVALPVAFKKSGNLVIGQLKQFFAGLAKGSAYKTTKNVAKDQVKQQISKLTTKEKETYTKAYANKKVDKKKYPTVEDFMVAQVNLKNKKSPVELKLWSKDTDRVKKLQNILGIKVDGVFGDTTELAVKKWQKKNNLIQDGVVGPTTWAKMT